MSLCCISRGGRSGSKDEHDPRTSASSLVVPRAFVSFRCVLFEERLASVFSMCSRRMIRGQCQRGPATVGSWVQVLSTRPFARPSSEGAASGRKNGPDAGKAAGTSFRCGLAPSVGIVGGMASRRRVSLFLSRRLPLPLLWLPPRPPRGVASASARPNWRPLPRPSDF